LSASGREDGEALALAHQAEIETALAALARNAPGPAEHALSDPTFANLYLFRRAHDYRYRPGTLPCITGHTYDGTRHLLPLFDLATADAGELRTLLQGGDCLYPLTAMQVAALDPARFEWTGSRDDADYLYPASHFRHYRGTKLNKKRNLAKQLRQAHAVTAQAYSVTDLDAALHVLAGWMKDKAKAGGDADETPCTEALQLASRLGLHGFLYRADGEPAGFVLAEPLRPGVWVMRFAKGLDRFKGIYQFMFQHFCDSLAEVHWLNFEQDMGLPNFRRSKLSYQPSALLPKFRARLRPR
jgi:hypothetical protein